MKATFPHMGTLCIPIRAMLEYLGIEVVLPPPSGPRTISLGVKHSPEVACFPLKMNLGNFMEAYERGADTILMAGGVGPCRFGYYAQVHREILRDLGYNYRMVVLEPPKGHIGELLAKIKYFTRNASWSKIWKAMEIAWEKFVAIDEMDKMSFKVRCRELKKGATTRVYKAALKWIDEAKDVNEIRRNREKVIEALSKVPQRPVSNPIRVGIVGEIFMVLEPAANLGIAEKLGEMGVEVDRSIMLSDWIKHHLLPIGRKREMEKVREAAKPYLEHFVGGEGLETIGQTVLYARRGFDGVVHIMPFTCMPEIVAQTILPRVSSEMEIPVITFVMDEHSGEAGVLTRLEAFIDLLKRKRQMKRAASRA